MTPLARRRTAAALVAAALVSGCVSPARREADRLLAIGDAVGAAARYDDLLSSESPAAGDDLLLFRAAVAHALAAEGTGDSTRSRDLLSQLLTRFPDSPHGPAAELLFDLLSRLDRQTQGLTEARLAASRLLPGAAARTTVESGERNGNRVGDELERLREILLVLQRRLDRLQAESRTREQELRALREEVDLLKAIDLDRPPQDGTPPP
jgi:hypothetical protein